MLLDIARVLPVVLLMLVLAANNLVPKVSSCMVQPPRRQTPVPRIPPWRLTSSVQEALVLLLTANCAAMRSALTRRLASKPRVRLARRPTSAWPRRLLLPRVCARGTAVLMIKQLAA
jgi:hypothetical protein